MSQKYLRPRVLAQRPAISRRKGVLAVLSAFVLGVMFIFLAIGIDTGRATTVQTDMQNSADAAALAAAQEIVYAIRDAGEEQNVGSSEESVAIDAASFAVSSARDVAVEVAEKNGFWIDRERDVVFGQRRFDEETETWPIEWNQQPYNTVKVYIRKTNTDSTANDAELRTTFGWAVGKDSIALETSAAAMIESRDLVLTLDFSRSMNFDSKMNNDNMNGTQARRDAAIDSLDAMWDTLVADDPKWPGTNESKFPSSGFAQIDSYEGTYMNRVRKTGWYGNGYWDYTPSNRELYYALGLHGVTFPQAGRNSSGLGTAKNKNTNYYTNRSRWESYISWVKSSHSGTPGYDKLHSDYRYRFGYRTLMNYMLQKRYHAAYSEDLWRTPHYPFHAVKEGTTLLTEFLDELGFGDEMGIVSYATSSRVETKVNDGYVNIDISADPITNNYSALNTLQRHKQAAEYSSSTGMGYGIRDARELLLGDPDDSSDNGYLRTGGLPTLIVMTDGQTNQRPSGWYLPSGFDWDDFTDYDGDGDANYSTSDRSKQYAFCEALKAVQHGCTVHTMSVGHGADTDLMRAIAFIGEGEFINVPGGTSPQQMELAMLDAFTRIASRVPPAKLIYDHEEYPVEDE